MTTLRKRNELPTVWEVPDALWERFVKPVLDAYDPAPKMGRPRANPRLCLDGIIYRARTGCQWNQLPEKFGDDATVHRTLARWESKQIFDKVWALLIYHCEELNAVHWEWQAADGCLNKAKFIGKKGAKAKRARQERRKQTPPQTSFPASPKASGQILVTEEKWASSRACLSRATAARLLSVSPEPM